MYRLHVYDQDVEASKEYTPQSVVRHDAILVYQCILINKVTSCWPMAGRIQPQARL